MLSVVLGGMMLAAPLTAQRPTPTRPTPAAPGKAAGTDSLAQLSKEREVFNWTPPDSLMRALLDREGYRKVQYQGDTVFFNALSRALSLKGKPSAVQRDETMIIGDSIVYNDSTKRVVAMGDTVLLRDPQQQDADDFIARGRIEYDLQSKQGVTGAFSTSVTSGQRLFLSAERGTIISDSLVSGRHIVFAKNGSFTYCDHAEPHFHFTTKDMKFVSENVMVARPGVLYIGEVPVFWACGVTPQAAVMEVKPPFAITHRPGHMFVSDLKDADLDGE